MGRFWDFVNASAPASEGKLPLVHSTDLYHFRDIQKQSELQPAECDVYRQQLLYFFYGRPSYRANSRKDTVTAKALLPVCLVMSRDILGQAVRIMPFDTGAFEGRKMHPPMHEAMAKEEFELAIASQAPMKVINVFYGNEKNYYNAKANSNVSGYDSFDELEIDSYFRLLHHRANTEFDDRITAIEVQMNTSVGLTGQVLAAILPKPFLDRPGIVEQIEKWGAVAIPYNVKEEFIPREVQGSIFDRLTDFLYQHRFLDRD